MGRGKRNPQQSKQSKANTDHVEERQQCEHGNLDNVKERQQFHKVPNAPKEQATPRKPLKRGKKTDPEEEDDTEEIEMEESLFQRLFKSLKKSLGGVPSRGRGKHKTANEPPFNIPPSKTSASIFELKNPFVTVTEDPEDVKGYDKVRLAQEEPMHVDAIRRLVRELVVPVIESKKACQARTELGYRDIHISFLTPFIRVVVPWKARPSKSVSSRNKRQTILQEDGGNEGVYFVFELSDPSDLVMKYEGDGETPATTEDRFGIRVMVHDSRIDSGDSLVTVAYVECKKDDDDLPEAIFQAGSYGKPAALENMQRGRFLPIFLQGFSKTKWKHGILVPHGSVTVEDGKVISFQSILPEDTVDSLNGVLKLAARDLKFAYPMWNAYPSGIYLLGLLYIDPKDRYLPLLNGEKDDALFYQTWLQIVAGQDARRLTRDEIDERCTRSVAGYHEEYDAYLEQMAESRNLV